MTYCMNLSASCFFPLVVRLFVHSLSILSFLLLQWNLGKEEKSAHVFIVWLF